MDPKTKLRERMRQMRDARTGGRRATFRDADDTPTVATIMRDLTAIQSIKGQKPREKKVVELMRSVVELDPDIFRMVCNLVGNQGMSLMLDRVVKKRDPELYERLKAILKTPEISSERPTESAPSDEEPVQSSGKKKRKRKRKKKKTNPDDVFYLDIPKPTPIVREE